MELPEKLIGTDKIVGYFAQMANGMYCSISLGKILVADTEEKLLQYLDEHKFDQKIRIKKIKFVDIAEKINDGCSFLFDKGSFIRFAKIAEINCIEDIPTPDLSGEDDNTFVACLSVLDQVSSGNQIH